MQPFDHQASLTPKISFIAQRLNDAYGMHLWRSHGDPIDELVATILSQNTSDANSSRAFAEMRAQFPTWNAVIAAPVSAVAAAIQSGGLANIKAPRVQAALQAWFNLFPDGNLESLKQTPVPEARATLCGLPGIGPKTASCVLLFSLGMPAMPVDTHVHRVALRTGIINSKASAEAAHEILESRLGGGLDQVYSFHLNVIRHGRQICRARNPLCGLCCISDVCDYYQSRIND